MNGTECRLCLGRCRAWFTTAAIPAPDAWAGVGIEVFSLCFHHARILARAANEFSPSLEKVSPSIASQSAALALARIPPSHRRDSGALPHFSQEWLGPESNRRSNTRFFRRS
jgi:hypothetical protein